MLEHFEEYMTNAPLMAIVLSYVAGVLTSYTPCVFPLIPITVSVIGAKSSTSKLHALMLSLVYVCGLALVYAALGLVAALTGHMFGRVSVHPLTNIIVANVCLIFALSMFDVFDIPLPRFLTQRRTANNQKRGLAGVFLMGAASGSIAAPCTAPVLGTILTYVASTQNALYGVLLLLAFAFGMGTLLVIVGVFSGIVTALPKNGAVMMTVKKLLALAMIVLAEYYLIRAGQLWW